MMQLELLFTPEERQYERWCRINYAGGLLTTGRLELWCWRSPSNDNAELPRTKANTALLRWKAKDLVPMAWEAVI